MKQPCLKLATITIVLVLTISFKNTYSQPVALDLNFGNAGIASLISEISLSSIALQSDSKLVAAGCQKKGLNYDFVIVRFNSDGTLDNSFGTSGITTTNILKYNFIYSIQIQTDGKIIAAGSVDSGTNSDFAIARYNTDGSLDNTFGTNGVVITPIGSGHEYAKSCVIQNDGKIIAGGPTIDANYNGRFALVRYTSNGTLDAGFGTSGKFIFSMISNNDDQLSSIKLQPDGKIVCVGISISSIYDYYYAVARCTVTGMLDNSFGTNGKVITKTNSNGSENSLESIEIQADGKIIVAGTAIYVAPQFCVIRYNPNGTLDNTFGNMGTALCDFYNTGNNSGGRILLQTDGKIIVAGRGYDSNSKAVCLLARFSPSGVLDNSFGTTGRVTNPEIAGASAGLLQTDGKIVVCGGNKIVRYNSGVTSVNEPYAVDKLTVYPNPTSDNFNIKFNTISSQAKLEVYNAKGKLIYNENIGHITNTVSLNEEPPGIYFIKIIEENQNILKQKIIKH